MRNALIVLGVLNFLGMIFTFLVPESNGKSLEEMSRENEGDEDDDGKAAEEIEMKGSLNSRTVPV